MQSYPELRVPMEALVEVMADPVILVVSENRSASFSSAAKVPSEGMNILLRIEMFDVLY